MPTLTIILLSYNTKNITENCLHSLYAQFKKEKNLVVEVIVVDNASTDGSADMLFQFRKHHKNFSVISNAKNLGFPKANNIAARHAKGIYLLFLNSDTLMKEMDFGQILTYMETHSQIGAMTVRVILPHSGIDKASHRGFPTVWNSFCYFTGLEKIFGNIPLLNRLFGGYHMTWQSLKTIHEIDSPSGAFYLIPKRLFQKTGGFDEDFFMYGEDLDLSFRVKAAGYKIVYYPYSSIIHLKYSSGLRTQSTNTKSKTKGYFYDAMRIFYQKHYDTGTPFFINAAVYACISLKKRYS